LILVFGKNGQVGNELSKYHENICLSSKDFDFNEPLMFTEIIRKYSPSAVINAAAYTDVDGAEDNEKLAYTINSLSPGELSKACSKLNIPLLHISTDYVFDGYGDSAKKENDKANPISIYGLSKYKGERNVINGGGQSVILRTSWVFSSHGKNFVKTMIKLSNNNEIVKVINDQFGAPTSAKSIAQACMKIISKMQKDKNLSGIFHFTGYPCVSWASFAEEIFSSSGKNTTVDYIKTSEFQSKAKRPLNSKLNCDKVYNEIGIKKSLWKEDLMDVLNEIGAIRND
jgi:dTDP-4-dehydrorhamnose reductase